VTTIPVAVLMSLLPMQQANFTVIRGPYGEPHVFAESLEAAFEGAGYAVAQDRLYQMDLSRRSARGQLSELIGRPGIASDRDALRFGYTDDEYAQMLAALPDDARTIAEAYARGVNRWIAEAAQSGKLPKQYGGERPRDWTPADSLAIGVQLVRRFGRFGAGELRNLALYTYLQSRPGLDARKAMDDLAWQNDKAAICTVSDADDPHQGRSPFPPLRPEVTDAHLKLLPKVNLLELLPAIRIEEQSEMKEIAAQLGVPHKWGSYAIVVSKSKSALGVPLLLSAPQMGFSTPSIAHQMSISCPEYVAVGMDVPGIPGVLIGHSPTVAWGLTSGVADTDDVFFVRLNPENPNEYAHDGGWRRFDKVEWTLKVRDGEPLTASREMTHFGPVILKSPSTGVAYVRKSPLWLKEVEGLAGMVRLPQSKGIEEVRRVALTFNANFNLFAATTRGDIGWFFCGRIPIRSAAVDPRLPAPMDAEHDWVGIVPPERMPYVINPSQGWIVNWNNKPVSWWPNLDTPAWGRIFRNEALVRAMEKAGKVTPQDLERFARMIATEKLEHLYFLPDLLSSEGARSADGTAARALDYLRGWSGDYFEGSVAPVVYDAWIMALREELFLAKLGNFLAPDLFHTVLQPTVIWNALRGVTQLDYLDGRRRSEVLWSSFLKAIARLENSRGADVTLWRYSAPKINFSGMKPVLYSDRGTYIQIVEMWDSPRGRFVAPPGVSEDPESPHSADQRDLAATWAFYPMLYKRSDFRDGEQPTK
jgi:penicillin amidase